MQCGRASGGSGLKDFIAGGHQRQFLRWRRRSNLVKFKPFRLVLVVPDDAPETSFDGKKPRGFVAAQRTS
jgi:hypothetical protein